MSERLIQWTQSPGWAIAITVGFYAFALWIRGKISWVHPLFLCCSGIILVLFLFQIPYEHYAIGGDWISVLLGPATVALAIPLYKQWALIRKHWLPIGVSIVTGTFVSFMTTIVIIHLFQGPQELLLSALPKSASSPIAIELVQAGGGIAELGAVLTVLTGLFGSMFGTWFLRKIGVHTDLAIGVAMGTASHGIGTSKVIRDSELQGAYSSLAMGVTGVVVSICAMFVYSWL